jgi:glucokinase
MTMPYQPESLMLDGVFVNNGELIMLLAGDIGGTKTTLATCSPATGPRFPLVQAEFLSANYAGLTAMVQEFLATVDVPVLHPASPSPLCAAPLNRFVAILAAEASNLALKVLAPGGLYLAGGILRHMLPALADGRFGQQLQGKGRFGALLAHMPIQVVTRQVALWGAARYGLEEMPPCNLA